MYQMAFLDAISKTGDAPVATGFLGDVLSSSPLLLEENLPRGHIYDQWHTHWKADELRSLLRVPVDDALDAVTAEMDALKGTIEGTRYKKGMLAEIWSRQRLFTSFQSSLSDYWRGTATPFLNHEYARFCFGLPRAALGQKQLLNAVYRRHYPRIAAIPGTYGPEPMLLTGRYLLKRRLAATLPPALLRGPMKGFRDVPPRMDIECVQAHGWRALWPIPEARGLLDEWLDTAKLDAAYDVVMSSKADMRPLRQLQSVQTFAWWLMQQHGTFPGPTA
jgi:hypothetical protein